MPSRCALGGNAGLLLDRPQGSVLSEYTCNVIRKSNTEIYLMCPFVFLHVSKHQLKMDVHGVVSPEFIGFFWGFQP